MGGGLRTAESGVPADADHPAEHIYFHARGRGVGDVPVGFCGGAGDGKRLRRAGADDAGVQQSGQRLADRAQPYGGGLQFASAAGDDSAAQAAELTKCERRPAEAGRYKFNSKRNRAGGTPALPKANSAAGATVRSRTAGSQGESPCRAIQKFLKPSKRNTPRAASSRTMERIIKILMGLDSLSMRATISRCSLAMESPARSRKIWSSSRISRVPR